MLLHLIEILDRDLRTILRANVGEAMLDDAGFLSLPRQRRPAEHGPDNAKTTLGHAEGSAAGNSVKRLLDVGIVDFQHEPAMEGLPFPLVLQLPAVIINRGDGAGCGFEFEEFVDAFLPCP